MTHPLLKRYAKLCDAAADAIATLEVEVLTSGEDRDEERQELYAILDYFGYIVTGNEELSE